MAEGCTFLKHFRFEKNVGLPQRPQDPGGHGLQGHVFFIHEATLALVQVGPPYPSSRAITPLRVPTCGSMLVSALECGCQRQVEGIGKRWEPLRPGYSPWRCFIS